MQRYAVRLDIRTDRPLTAERIESVQGGRWEISAIGQPRGRRLAVTMVMDASDPAGALIRAQNVVFDTIPGEVTKAELAVTKRPPPATRRRR